MTQLELDTQAKREGFRDKDEKTLAIAGELLDMFADMIEGKINDGIKPYRLTPEEAQFVYQTGPYWKRKQ